MGDDLCTAYAFKKKKKVKYCFLLKGSHGDITDKLIRKSKSQRKIKVSLKIEVPCLA